MQEPPTGWTREGIVVNVVDGDTIDVEITEKFRLRLIDVWAPETRTKDLVEKKKGLKIKEYLVKKILGHRITFFVPSSGEGIFKNLLTLDRILARIFLDGEDMNEKINEEIKRVG